MFDGLKNLGNLRVLQIYHCHQYPLDRLARNPVFANLTHLLLYPHALEPDVFHRGQQVSLHSSGRRRK